MSRASVRFQAENQSSDPVHEEDSASRKAAWILDIMMMVLAPVIFVYGVYAVRAGFSTGAPEMFAFAGIAGIGFLLCLYGVSPRFQRRRPQVKANGSS